jgi:hypothetical protein
MTYDIEERDKLLDDIKRLDDKGYSQAQIGEKLGYSQQHVSRLLSVLVEERKARRANDAERLAREYEACIANARLVRLESWSTYEKTSDARSRSVLLNTVLNSNRQVMELVAAGDIVQSEIDNANILLARAKAEVKAIEDKRLRGKDIDPKSLGVVVNAAVTHVGIGEGSSEGSRGSGGDKGLDSDVGVVGNVGDVGSGVGSNGVEGQRFLIHGEEEYVSTHNDTMTASDTTTNVSVNTTGIGSIGNDIGNGIGSIVDSNSSKDREMIESIQSINEEKKNKIQNQTNENRFNDTTNGTTTSATIDSDTEKGDPTS